MSKEKIFNNLLQFSIVVLIVFIFGYLLNSPRFHYQELIECQIGTIAHSLFSNDRVFDLSYYFSSTKSISLFFILIILKPLTLLFGETHMIMKIAASIFTGLGLFITFKLLSFILYSLKISKETIIWLVFPLFLFLLFMGPTEFKFVSVSTLPPFNTILFFTSLLTYIYFKFIFDNFNYIRVIYFASLAILFYFERLMIIFILCLFLLELTTFIKNKNVRKNKYLHLSYLIFFIFLTSLNVMGITSSLFSWFENQLLGLELSAKSISTILNILDLKNSIILLVVIIVNLFIYLSSLRHKKIPLVRLLSYNYTLWLLYVIFMSHSIQEYYVLILYPLFLVLFLESLTSFSKKKKHILLNKVTDDKTYRLTFILLVALLLFVFSKPSNLLGVIKQHTSHSQYDFQCYHEVSRHAIKDDKYKFNGNILDFFYKCKKLGFPYDMQCLRGLTSVISNTQLYNKSFWEGHKELLKEDLNALAFGLGLRTSFLKEKAQLSLITGPKFDEDYLNNGIYQECFGSMYLSNYAITSNKKETKVISFKPECKIKDIPWNKYFHRASIKFKENLMVTKQFLDEFVEDHSDGNPFCSSIIKKCLLIHEN